MPDVIKDNVDKANLKAMPYDNTVVLGENTLFNVKGCRPIRLVVPVG